MRMNRCFYLATLLALICWPRNVLAAWYDDFDFVYHSLNTPYEAGRETGGEVRLEYRGSVEIDIDAARLTRVSGPSVTWRTRTDDRNVYNQWYRGDGYAILPHNYGNFFLTPDSSGTLTLALELRLIGESSWYEVVRFSISVASVSGSSGGGDGSGFDSGDVEDDIDVADHDFTDNYEVGYEFCGDIELRNNGSTTYEIDRAKVDPDGISVDCSDNIDTTDRTLDPGDDRWFGDPFCCTALEAGELRLRVKVRLEDDSTWYTVDNIYIDIVNPDPCAGLTCGDYCSGGYRYWGGVPIASGSTCSCSYVSLNCNAMDLTGSETLYCSGGNVRGRRSLTDYSCSSGSCISSTSWTGDRLAEGCGGRGCSEAGGARCNPVIPVSETVTDLETGLIWMQSSAASSMNLATAVGYCDGLEFAGRNDWRLPTVDELRTLIVGCPRNETGGFCPVRDPGCLAMSCWSSSNCGACTTFGGSGGGGCYWSPDTWGGSCGWYASASRVSGTPTGQWVVGFHRGHPSDGGTGGLYAVRCVTDEETLDPCAEITCSDICEGNTRIWGRSCDGGACAEGSRTDCDLMDLRETQTYCNERQVWQRTWLVDYSCADGSCAAALGQFVDQLGLQSCAFGCIPETTGARCRPNPCEGLTCPDTCDGEIRQFNGITVAASDTTCECVYETMDCNAMDTSPSTFEYCGMDDLLHAVDSFVDYICESETVSCVGELRETNLRVVEECRWGCAYATCLPCIPAWDCTEWSDCNGPAEQIRTCADQNECGSLDGQPALEATCPCELADAYWATTYAQDGDTVELVVETYGECVGRSLYLEIQETDGTLIDALLSHGLEGSFVIEIDPDGITSRSWMVTFTEDWGGISEYLFRADLVGADDTIESNNVIEVEPRSISLGTVGSLLLEFPLPVDPCPDYGTTMLSSACIAEREAAGVHGQEEPRWVEILEEIFEWVGWMYLADCGVCIGSLGSAAVVTYLCPPVARAVCTSVFPPAFSTSIVTCGICLGGGPSASAAARRAVAEEARTVTVQMGAEVRQLELTAEAAEIQYIGNGVRLTYESAGVPIVEELVLDATMALRGIRYEAPPWPYLGDVEFLNFRKNNPLLLADYSSLLQGRAVADDLRFTVSLFADEVFPQRASEIVNILGRGRYTLLDAHIGEVASEVGGIRFITDVAGQPTLYAGALPATGEMRIMVGSLRQAVEAGDTAMTGRFFDTILSHEYGHLMMWKLIRRLPDPLRGDYYQRNTLTFGPYRWNRHVEEYFNDRFVMEALGEADVELLARYQNGILSQVEATVGSNRDRWIRTWVTRRTELTFDYQWQMLRFYNLARDLELTLARTMLADLRRFARRNLTRREASESVREFLRLADELREDGGTFAREVQEESGSAAVLDTVLRRYNLVVPPVE